MTARTLRRRTAAVAVLALAIAGQATVANAAPNNVSIQLNKPTPSATGASYTWTWSGYQTAAVSCVLVRFSVNADGTGGIPTGMGVTAATLGGTYGGTWTADYTNAGTGVVAFNSATAVTPAAAPSTLVVGNVSNSSAAGSYYETITTYDTAGTGTSGACAGSVRDAATVAAFAVTAGQAVTVTVDPSLSFTINPVNSGTVCGDATTTLTTTTNSINLGRLGAISQHPIGGQNLNVVTNAANGYTVYVSYTGALTGQNSAAAFANVGGTNAAPIVWPSNGTEAFGYSTSSSSLSGTADRFRTNKWAALTTTGTEVMRNTATPGASGDTNCVAFQASVAGNTKADTYTTTVQYNAAPVF